MGTHCLLQEILEMNIRYTKYIHFLGSAGWVEADVKILRCGCSLAFHPVKPLRDIYIYYNNTVGVYKATFIQEPAA